MGTYTARVCTLLALGAIGAAPLVARANDTELTYGGTPRPLTGNTTVSMRSETVRVDIGEKLTTVDCQFTFVNNGPARTVRVGFPDEGSFEEDEADGPPKPAKGTFETFRSWVNGRPVQTTVVRGAEAGSVWHVKNVRFEAGQTLQIRNRYTVQVGSSVAYSPVAVHLAKYVLRTGASWRGPIGRSEVVVTFRRKGVKSPIVARRLPDLSDVSRQERFAKTMDLGKRTVYYRGPVKPTVSGATMRFVRSSWRPTPNDDVYLIFDMSRLRLSPEGE